MYVKSRRPSAKREVQNERSAQRDDRTLRSAKRAVRMCPRSGQIFFLKAWYFYNYFVTWNNSFNYGVELMYFFNLNLKNLKYFCGRRGAFDCAGIRTRVFRLTIDCYVGSGENFELNYLTWNYFFNVLF